MGGKKADPNKAAMRAQKDQMKRLDKIDLPTLEKLALESPELVGLLDAEQLDPSAMEGISTDPRLQENQMAALEAMRERAEGGLSTQDRYMMEELMGQAGAQEKSQRAAIEQDMAERGMDDSGQSLMMKLQNQQASANQGRKQAMQMANQAAQGKQSALANMANMSGNMQNADFSRQAQKASARDAIAKANAMNRQSIAGQNLAARQAIANQQSATANQNQMYNKNIAQQNFQNQLSKATGQGAVASNMSNISANAGQKPGGLQSALGGAATGASIGSQFGVDPASKAAGAGYGAAAGAGLGLISSAFEDGGVVKQQAHAEVTGEIDEGRRQAEEEVRAEAKQRAQFKKKYMKEIHDEMLKSKAEVTGEPEKKVVHAQDGTESAIGTSMFNFPKREDLNARRLGINNDSTSANVQTAQQANNVMDKSISNKEVKALEKDIGVGTEEVDQGISGDSLSKGLGALSKIMGDSQPENKAKLNLQAPQMQMPQNVLGQGMDKLQQFNNPFTAEDGGSYYSDGSGEVVDSGMDSFAGDRVDAKLNDGEIVLNIPQQQRLMDLIRGEISPNELGTEDIVEGVPEDYRDEMHEELEDESAEAKLKKLLEGLGR